MPVIGFLGAASPGPYATYVAAFHRGLKEAGYIAGQNVTIEYRWAENQNDRLPALAVELVRRQVTVIATLATGAMAAKAATTTIPIVFLIGEDPVRLGLVASLAQPGGDLTGINLISGELTAKRLELLREIVPSATRAAVLVNPTGPNAESTLRDVQSAARAVAWTSGSQRSDPPRDQCSFRNSCARAARRAFRRPRPLFNKPACPVGHPGDAPCGPKFICGT